MKSSALMAALVTACLPFSCFSKTTAHANATRLDALLVTASPVDTLASEALRSVLVIDRIEIERAGSISLADLLARQPGLQIQRRGAPGVQADIGIRGSNFEQTLILIDGVPIQNPQAGHHNLDVPVPLAHIERIEIVKGPGAIQYGGSVTGGVINLITRRPEATEGELLASFGEHRTRQLSGYLATATAASQHGLSVSSLDSDGDTARSGPSDARLRQALYSGAGEIGATRLDWGAGAVNKDFGAWGFYSAEYPDARERTTARMAWLGSETTQGDWRLSARLHADAHDDWFLTRIGGRDYINQHETRVAGLQASLRRDDAHGAMLLGTDLRRERIESNALRDHRRDKSAFWLLRHQNLGERSRAEVSLNRAEFDGYRGRWLPSLALAHDFSERWRGFASQARSARAPSWTELFLDTAANRGNAQLEPETSDYAELGIERNASAHDLQLVLYQRRTHGLIDWTRTPGTVAWIAHNVDGYRGRGAELQWRWRPAVEWLGSLGLAHERLRTAVRDAGPEVKYSLQVPRRAWLADARLNLGERIDLDIDLRRPSYANQSTATLANLQLSWRAERLRLFVQVQNLLDETVVETGFAPIPGRWLSAGFEVRL